jgi:hypothetical protein
MREPRSDASAVFASTICIIIDAAIRFAVFSGVSEADACAGFADVIERTARRLRCNPGVGKRRSTRRSKRTSNKVLRLAS